MDIDFIDKKSFIVLYPWNDRELVTQRPIFAVACLCKVRRFIGSPSARITAIIHCPVYPGRPPAPSPKGTMRFPISNNTLFTARAAPSAFGTSPDGEVRRYRFLPPIKKLRGAINFVRRSTTTHYAFLTAFLFHVKHFSSVLRLRFSWLPATSHWLLVLVKTLSNFSSSCIIIMI